ncbi:unnamed protein product [Gulo gulo]|uniref:Uncharacterized protein n=1 Tax=Gulo gulo TaxID=48420 RepID=A0A9X9LKV8_GULGU|nr:unnamed protein product [Gulo gulo]
MQLRHPPPDTALGLGGCGLRAHTAEGSQLLSHEKPRLSIFRLSFPCSEDSCLSKTTCETATHLLISGQRPPRALRRRGQKSEHEVPVRTRRLVMADNPPRVCGNQPPPLARPLLRLMSRCWFLQGLGVPSVEAAAFPQQTPRCCKQGADLGGLSRTPAPHGRDT